MLLGTFSKLPMVTLSFNMAVRKSVRLCPFNNSAPTARILIKFDIWPFLQKSVKKIQM